MIINFQQNVPSIRLFPPTLLFFFCWQNKFSRLSFYKTIVSHIQYQFGCGILKMVGPKKQDFWPKINNHCIFRIWGAPVRQKLDMILENKVVQKLKLEKNVFYKKWSPKLIFLNKCCFFEKINHLSMLILAF